MNFVILDSDGNELALERVSLIPGGMELVVGVALEKSVPVCPAEPQVTAIPKEVPSNVIPSAADVAPDAPSVFGEATVDSAIAAGDTGVEVDKNGVPWDERIHSSSKKISGKGIWAKRRNLADGVYETITAELLSGQPQPEPAPVSQERPTPITSAIPDVPTAAPVVPVLDTAGAQAVAEVPAPPSAGQAPEVPAPLPENNQIGDANDSALSGILSAWGSNA